jgi:hypothetical protein
VCGGKLQSKGLGFGADRRMPLGFTRFHAPKPTARGVAIEACVPIPQSSLEAVQKEYWRAVSSGATTAKLCNTIKNVSRKISRHVTIAGRNYFLDSLGVLSLDPMSPSLPKHSQQRDLARAFFFTQAPKGVAMIWICQCAHRMTSPVAPDSCPAAIGHGEAVCLRHSCGGLSAHLTARITALVNSRKP